MRKLQITLKIISYSVGFQKIIIFHSGIMGEYLNLELFYE